MLARRRPREVAQVFPCRSDRVLQRVGVAR